jgi:xanthine dehydrogenase molybdopterin-binding subunit B
MWHGATVRSTIPRGRIRAIHYDPRIDWSEFVIATAADVPGKNHIQMISADQPCLAADAVNHCDEPIVLLAHPDKRRLPEAVAAVRIDYDPLARRFVHRRERNQREIIWGEDNVFKQFHLEKGNVDDVWATAAHIVEGEYRTGAQEHLYIENNGVIAEYSEPKRTHRLGIAAMPLLCT